MAGSKSSGSRSMAASLLTLRWKKMKAAFADACTKLLAPHVLVADASHLRRVRAALPPACLQGELKTSNRVKANKLAPVENVLDFPVREVNEHKAINETSSSGRSSDAGQHVQGTNSRAEEETIVLEEYHHISKSTESSVSETVDCPSGEVVDNDVKNFVDNVDGGFDNFTEFNDIQESNLEKLDVEVDEREPLDLQSEISDGWNEGLQSVIEEELEDILSGLHRRLSGLQASSHYGKKIGVHSLSAISEEMMEITDDQGVEVMCEKQSLQKLNSSVCNLTQRHEQRAKELEEERMHIRGLQSELSGLRLVGFNSCMATDSSTSAALQKDKNSGVVFKDSETEGNGNGVIVSDSQHSGCLGKVSQSIAKRGLGPNGRDRMEVSQLEELTRLQRKVTEMDIATIEREQQFRRQREELSQLWRTASEMGQKAAAERSNAKSEKNRADRAEQSLEALRISEANLAEQVKTTMHKNSQLKVALACLYDQDSRTREEELEALVARLQSAKVEVEEKVAKLEIQGEQLEKEVVKLKKANKVLVAKLGWMAKSKQELEDEVKELAALVNQRDAEQADERSQPTGLSTHLWTLMGELVCNSKSEAEELAHLRLMGNALMKEFQVPEKGSQTVCSKRQLLDVAPQDKLVKNLQISSFSQEEIDTAESFLRSVEGVKDGDEGKGGYQSECKGNLLYRPARDSFSFWDVVNEAEFPVPASSSGDNLSALSTSSSLDKWDNSSSTSSSTFGSPNLYPRKVDPR